MGEFRAVYMRCTQEQFERMRPKLEKSGCELSIYAGENIKIDNILSNNVCDENIISNIHKCYLREFSGVEVNTEAEFLEACGYVEEETLQEKEQRLLRELEEVRSKIKDQEPKVGDIGIYYDIKSNNNSVGLLTDFLQGDIFKYKVNDKNAWNHFEPLPKELQEQLKPYFNAK